MDASKQVQFTRTLFIADMALNVFLGSLLTILPAWSDRIITSSRLVPPVIYQIIGVIFLLYAAWQIWVIIKGQVTSSDAKVFAAVMALAPVILLTTALLFVNLPLKLYWRIILWIGNSYMLLLAAWYIFIARVPGQGD